MLTAVKRGPYTMFRPICPNVPGVGAANAATLNHELMLWPPATAVGSPTTFGYHSEFDESEKLLLTCILGVNGLPPCATKSVKSVQPPIAASRGLLVFANLRPRPKGSSYAPCPLNIWRMSKFEGP